MVRMTVAGLRPGQKVTSIQGRDSGRDYLIVGFDGDYFLLVADGSGRLIKRPKRKNLKHVRISMLVDEEIEEKLTAGRQVSDDDLRRSLQRLREETEKGEIKLE